MPMSAQSCRVIQSIGMHKMEDDCIGQEILPMLLPFLKELINLGFPLRARKLNKMYNDHDVIPNQTGCSDFNDLAVAPLVGSFILFRQLVKVVEGFQGHSALRDGSLRFVYKRLLNFYLEHPLALFYFLCSNFV